MKESSQNLEDIDIGKPTKINELLEPLVQENKPNKLTKSLNYIEQDLKKLNNFETPHNNIFQNKSNNTFNRIQKEIKDLNNINETQNSNYSNIPGTEAVKAQNFVFIMIITVFSSLQFGIFVYIFNLYMKSISSPTKNNLTNNFNIPNISKKGLFYSFFLVLSWKYEIYLIIYLIYGTYIYFRMKNKCKKEQNNNYVPFNEDGVPLINRNNSFSSQDNFIISIGGNPAYKFREFKYKYLQKFGYSYGSYYKIFTLTSNIFDLEENTKNFIHYYFNLNEMIKGFTGILFSYILFVGSYFYYFGIIYLMQEMTSLLPYYIQYNKKLPNNNDSNSKLKRYLSKNSNKGGNNGEYYKYVFPLLIGIGLYFLQKTIINNPIFLLPILFCCVLAQLYNQKKFVLNSHEESPFQILFRTYFNYAIISIFLVLAFEVLFNGFHIINLFYWITNLKLFFACLIGFGIFGAICYNMLIIFMRISLSNNIIVKLIKYFNLIIIDLVGVYIFRQYIISSYIDYIFGIALCALAMFLLDFHKIL